MQNPLAHVEGNYANDRYQLTADPCALIPRLDKNTSDYIPFKAGSGNDVLIDGCHINPTSRH